MADAHTIVFLYSDRLVPPEVMEMVEGGVPEGFTLEPVEQGTSPEIRKKKIAQADFIIAYPGDPSADEINAATRLKLFQMLSAGHDWLNLSIFAHQGIPVANNGGANAPTVAEHAILLTLAVFKRLPEHHNALVNGHWVGATRTLQMRELRGKTVGILGFGRIGQEFARLARGFGTNILYNDTIQPSFSVREEIGAVYAPFDNLFERSDVISVHTPLTNTTKGMVDARALGLMKNSAILVNTSRGPVIDEAALIGALQNDEIAGAGLDVFSVEPLEGESPLFSLNNVVLTSHIAGVTLDTWSRRIAFGFANIQRVARGQEPESVVGSSSK